MNEAAMQLPQYLQPAEQADYYFGTLSFDEQTDHWIIKGEPAVCQFAKKLFPGADGRDKGIARFKSNKRTNGDLNWLMMRYPLRVESPEAWERTYRNTIDYIIKRESIRKSPQKLVPSSLYFRGELAEFQKVGAAFLQNNAPTLLADDMGLGKTVQGLAWIAANGNFPGIIVVPPSVQVQWKSQIERFIIPQPLHGQQSLIEDKSRMVHIIKGLRPYDLPEANVYIIHYGLLRAWKQELPHFGLRFAIFDEIQELRHTGTEKYSAASALSESVDAAIGLSGTPVYNNGGEIYNILNALEHGCLGDWGSFTREWCYGYGSDVVTDPELLGEHLRREGLMLRRTKQEVLTELPPKRRIVQEIDADETMFNQEMRSVLHLLKNYEGIADHFERGRAKQQLGEAVRKATGIAKAPYVAAFVKLLLEAGEPVILYGYHHDVYDIWMDELEEFHPARVTGRETGAQKEEAKRRFVQGETNLMIISLRAAAGIDGLQHRSNISVFGELDWSPGVHSQCEDRQHRIGQEGSVLCYYLVTATGSDEQMMEALGFKTAQFVGIMGEKGETEEDKAIAQVVVGKHIDKVIAKVRDKFKSRSGRSAREEKDE